jgi:hypothetical protein
VGKISSGWLAAEVVAGRLTLRRDGDRHRIGEQSVRYVEIESGGDHGTGERRNQADPSAVMKPANRGYRLPPRSPNRCPHMPTIGRRAGPLDAPPTSTNGDSCWSPARSSTDDRSANPVHGRPLRAKTSKPLSALLGGGTTKRGRLNRTTEAARHPHTAAPASIRPEILPPRSVAAKPNAQKPATLGSPRAYACQPPTPHAHQEGGRPLRVACPCRQTNGTRQARPSSTTTKERYRSTDQA